MFNRLQKMIENTPKTIRVILLLIYDALAVCAAEFFSLWTRFEFRISQITPEYLNHAIYYLVINIILTIAIFAFMRLYNSLWQYASVQ